MNEKQLAAQKSVEFIKEGMIVGLGTGSTVNFMLEALAKEVKKGLKIKAVATSKLTFQLASSFGIDVTDPELVDKIDITIDGADEVDAQLNGIKGGGAALLYEKIIASNSLKNIWIVDSSKVVNKLGKFPLPVEVVPFGANLIYNRLDKLNFNPVFRKNGSQNFLTDGGHFIIDLHMDNIEDSILLEKQLKSIPGVVEVGLFNNVADLVIVGKGSKTELLEKKK